MHGCFWHRHEGCPAAAVPKTRTDFWLAKFARTVERDRRKQCQLEEMGWKVVTVWECELQSKAGRVLDRLRATLTVTGAPAHQT